MLPKLTSESLPRYQGHYNELTYLIDNLPELLKALRKQISEETHGPREEP